ncbi:pilus assembly protein TadG-related protein [Fulvimarina sp. MAC8]|uniref:pilus assembly protein TadG-related protein n=1 Tax=Fulvimarina sp. MAC8 TaxID=3162874 RepID=UPI0032EC5A2A
MISPTRFFGAGSQDGNIAITFALMLPVVLGFGSYATDLGLAYVERRALQAASDAAALAAIRHPDDAEAVAAKVFAASSQENVTFDLVFGSYDASRPRDERFQPGVSSALPVVRIEARKPHTYFLARALGIHGTDLAVRSDAAIDALVAFQAGSRLASIDPTLLNTILDEAIGAKLSLDVLDYSNLAQATVALGDLMPNTLADASGPQNFGAGIQTEMPASDLLSGLSDALADDGRAMAAASMRKAAQSPLALNARLRVSDLIDLRSGDLSISRNKAAEILNTRLSALDVIDAVVRQAASGHSASFDLVLPMLGAVDIDVLIGEAMKSTPALAVASLGQGVETGQAKLRFHTETTNPLDGLGIGLDIPIEAILAGGRAEIAAINCSSDPNNQSVTIAVTPGLARFSLGRWTKPLQEIAMNDRLAYTPIVEAIIATVEARGNLAVENVEPILVTFTGADIASGKTKTVETTAFISSPMSSLFRETELTARVGLLGLSTGSLTASIHDALAFAATPLDALLGDILKVAGIGLGEIDVKVSDVLCRNARIVG